MFIIYTVPTQKVGGDGGGGIKSSTPRKWIFAQCAGGPRDQEGLTQWAGGTPRG